MYVRDLAWLVELAERGHVTETAAALGTTQPTLSRALARVETELGVRLFERHHEGVALTPYGELVVDAATTMSDRWQQLTDTLAGMLDPDAGIVRLAFLDSMATSVVPALLRDFHRAAPRVRVLLSQEPAHEIAADLRTGAADLAVCSPIPEAGGWHPIQEERLVLAVPPAHRLAARKRVRVADLAGEELVTTPRGFGFRALVDAILASGGVSPAISFESQDLATIEGLVAAGLGVAILPEHLAGASGTAAVPLAHPQAKRTIGLTWRRDRPLAPAAERFREFVVAARAGW
ncbi:MAG: LysR family transcriptional regulator [Nocardioidaceae bacterium]|nr:LysR family transcriptional regulator [Nocardioidaceae bacterium]